MERRPILLADDDENDVLLMLRAFQKAGMNIPVQIVRDGEMAISYLAGRAPYEDRAAFPLPSLLLLDLKMPKKSGFDVLEWRRQDARLRRLVTVVLSASRDVSDVNRAYDLGANSYLVKPSTFDQLQVMVAAIKDYWIFLNQPADAL